MRLLLFSMLAFCSLSLSAQRYARVKVLLDHQHTIQLLAETGVAVDHGYYQPGKYFTGEFSDTELTLVQAAGFHSEVLIADLQATPPPAENSSRSLPPCPAGLQPAQYQTPFHYQPGSMGDYFTYQEMLENLNQMAADYPDIFKTPQPISTSFTTHGGNSLFWVKVSDNPNTDETDEPEVLYTALHHAREPNSLSQMIFYLWYLLEHYETDPEVKYLVDHVEMYFVPCLNPDGYLYNEFTNPDGQGFWRKNRRDNGDGTFGVDLNRNYGYQWGFNDAGSSPEPASEVYRGPGPFSEPETQMIRNFCLTHQFQMALNYHTYGNLLIYPWGYTDGPTPDNATFSTFGPWLTRDNHFKNGFGTQTVGYTTNGGSDDWMYGEMTDKPKIFSMTPEVGPAFWPSPDQIDLLNKTCMTQNLTLAHLVLNYGQLSPAFEPFVADLNGQVSFNLKKFGLAPGMLTVYLEPVSDNIASVGPPVNFGLLHLEEASGNLSYGLQPSVQDEDSVKLNIVLDNGLYQWRQPVVFIYSSLVQQPFADDASSLDQWEAQGGWNITSEQFYSAPTSITDSPQALYAPNTVSEVTFTAPLPVKDATHLLLSFQTRWDIEEDEDFAQVLVSFDGGNYFPLCGKYTEPGTQQQAFEEPLYDGIQQNWVKEEIDLTEYLDLEDSLNLYVAFRMISDDFIEADGFYFDDVKVTIVKEDLISATHEMPAAGFRFSARPNPAGAFLLLETDTPARLPAGMKLEVFDQLGQAILSQPVLEKSVRLHTDGWQKGVYQYRITGGGRQISVGRFVKS